MNSRLANKLTSKLATKVDIFVSCRKLLDMDVFSKSDPMCVMYQLLSQKWIEMGRTEKIMNDLNPQFSTSFKLDYFFEEVQKVRFSVFDIDNLSPQLDDDDYLGSAETTLGEIVSNNPLVLPLYMKGNSRAGEGKIILRAVEESGERDNTIKLHLSATRLDKKDFFGKSDPYLEFSKVMPDGGTQVTHRTEVIDNTLNPVWKEFEIRASRLCDGGADDIIKVTCYDDNTFSPPNLIGSFETSLTQLTAAQQQPTQTQWPCINPKKKAKKSSYKDSGVVSVLSCKVTPTYTFLDFVFGGLQLKFSVSIDFTASNGDPRNPDSLHYLDNRFPNHYVRAINSVGQVIKDYDSTQQFACMGFGARVPPSYSTSHCFNLKTFTPDNSYVHGIQGILDSYHQSLSSVQLYGPTNFAPTIHHVSKLAQNASQNRSSCVYHVLLVLTDGVISDMSHTIQAIISASSLPLSIIIVGVGGADFEAMDRLDSDDRLLSDAPSGRVAKRDIVQFVPFRDFEGASEEVLGGQVLAELPGQVLSYYSMAGIQPGDPKRLDESKFNAPSENVLPHPTNPPPSSSNPYPPPPSSNPYPPPPSSNPYPPPPSSNPYPPQQTNQYPPPQTNQYPPLQTNQYPPPQTNQYPPQSNQYPPPQQTNQYPPQQTNQYPPPQQTNQYPPHSSLPSCPYPPQQLSSLQPQIPSAYSHSAKAPAPPAPIYHSLNNPPTTNQNQPPPPYLP